MDELGVGIDWAVSLDSSPILDSPSRKHSPNPSKRARNHILVIDTPTIDLDTYINGYRGRTKILRLLHIASSCPSLSVDAYRLALSVIQTDTLDVVKYTDTLAQLNTCLTNRGLSRVYPDQLWVQQAQRTARVECDRLDAELRTYRHNSIKDSIRMGYNDLAEYHVKCGDFSNAIKCFLKARENATSPKSAVHHTVNLIHCYLLMNQFQQVQINLVRLASLNDDKDKKSTPVAVLEIAFQALVHLHEGSHKNVAKDLLQLKLPDTANHIEEVITCNDVAIIGGLCALATFSREELKRELESNSFRGFLDLEPHIRETMTAFVNAQYAKCLSLLTTHMNDRLLDLHLWYHMEPLMAKIRHRAIAQYCLPYSTVSLTRMARAFACDAIGLEAEVATLIVQGDLDMRIDGRAKVLRKRARNERTRAFTNVLSTGEHLALSRQQALLKMSLAQANLAVLPPKPATIGCTDGDGGPTRNGSGCAGRSSRTQSNVNHVVASTHLMEQMQWAISQSLAPNHDDGSE